MSSQQSGQTSGNPLPPMRQLTHHEKSRYFEQDTVSRLDSAQLLSLQSNSSSEQETSQHEKQSRGRSKPNPAYRSGRKGGGLYRDPRFMSILDQSLEKESQSSRSQDTVTKSLQDQPADIRDDIIASYQDVPPPLSHRSHISVFESQNLRSKFSDVEVQGGSPQSPYRTPRRKKFGLSILPGPKVDDLSSEISEVQEPSQNRSYYDTPIPPLSLSNLGIQEEPSLPQHRRTKKNKGVPSLNLPSLNLHVQGGSPPSDRRTPRKKSQTSLMLPGPNDDLDIQGMRECSKKDAASHSMLHDSVSRTPRKSGTNGKESNDSDKPL